VLPVVLTRIRRATSHEPPLLYFATLPGRDSPRQGGSDAVNVLYPRWGISMRRRTGAVGPQATESFLSPYDFLRIMG